MTRALRNRSQIDSAWQQGSANVKPEPKPKAKPSYSSEACRGARRVRRHLTTHLSSCAPTNIRTIVRIALSEVCGAVFNTDYPRHLYVLCSTSRPVTACHFAYGARFTAPRITSQVARLMSATSSTKPMIETNKLNTNTFFIEVSGAGLAEVDGLFVPSTAQPTTSES